MPAPIPILYWTDHPRGCESGWSALEKAPSHFLITKVTTLAEFETRLFDNQYDLILADFDKLDFENLNLLDLFQAKNLKIPLVIITNTASIKTVVEAMKRGVADLIIKTPRHLQKLPHTLQAIAQKKRQQEQQEQQDHLEKIKSAYQQAQTSTWELQVEINERKRAEESLRRSVERLRNLQQVDRDILIARSPAAIVQTALKRLRQLIPCQWANLAMFNFETQEIVILATDPDPNSLVQTSFHQSFESVWLARLKQGKVLIVEDTLDATRPSPLAQTLLAEGVRSYLNVPLIAQDELLGVVNLAANLPNAFDSEHVEVAVEVTNLLAVALQQARLFEQVSSAGRRLEALSRQLLVAQETERRHIARELHDEIGQGLSLVKIDLQTIQQLPQATALASRLSESVGTVEHALKLVRALSVELRPALLDDLGLIPALRWYIDRQAQRGGFAAHLLADPFEARLSPELEIVCYRIVQEALTNVIRYAQASQVEVELQQHADELRLLIRDNGIGFDVPAALKQAMHGTNLGLLSMQERALLVDGQVEINSIPQHGTEIRAHFLLKFVRPSPLDL